MGYVRKIKGSLITQELEEYVGEESYMFYDIENGTLRMWDGTPGGKPISGYLAEFPTFGDFPIVGDANNGYIDASTNYIYRWDGSDYVSLCVPALNDHISDTSNPHSTTITNLFDTDVSSPSDGDILKYNGTSGKWEPDPHVSDTSNPHSTTITNLSDTDASSPSDGDLLRYNGTSDKWEAISYLLGDLNDVDTDMDSPGYVWSMLVYDIDNNNWQAEAKEDHRPRNQYGYMFIVPSETVHPTVTYTAGQLGTLPFYPYKTGWSIDPPVWHGFHFLYDNVWSDYKTMGNMFSLNSDGRIECNWYGDVHLTVYTTLSHSSNGASVGIAVSRYRPGVGEQYFPVVSMTEMPNGDKPRTLVVDAIFPVWPEDKLGLGICTDIAGTITFYDGSYILEGIMSYIPGIY